MTKLMAIYMRLHNYSLQAARCLYINKKDKAINFG